MKIIVFTENLRAGGKERRITELLKALRDDKRFEFEVVLTRGNIHYKNFLDLGIPVHILERKWIKKDPRIFFMFFRLMLRLKPQLIHVWGHMPAVYALPTKLLLGIPMINSEIADSAPQKKLLAKNLVFRFSDVILSNTHAGIKSYKAPDSKSKVIYNGFCFSRIQNLIAPEAIKAKFRINTPFTVGMVASFLINKDYETFVQAAIGILNYRKDITFLCIGDGDSTHIQTTIPEELKDFILFPGKQSAVEKIMNVCNVGVLTTNIRAHGEGISNSLLEFMALGKPVIATRFGGTTELIQDQENGFLIDAFNPGQLSERIIHLIDQPEQSGKIGAAARSTIKSKFSIEQMTERFISEYLPFIPKNDLWVYENTNDRVTAA